MEKKKSQVQLDAEARDRMASEGPAPAAPAKGPNHSHAWRGTWDRPMSIDEDAHHPFTIARMTDRNVRGLDD